MRLLQISGSGKLTLNSHDVERLPPYAILSHRWGSDAEEVTFDDIKKDAGKEKAGYAKILFCGEKFLKDDLKHFWVDTCCIDKRNHSELSESIISMFRWYHKATKCYVYMNDVSASKHGLDGSRCDWRAAFRASAWFRRGLYVTRSGTLQELLAPSEVEFWSRDEQLLGSKESLKDLVHEITGIPLPAILGAPLFGFSTSERLRWAAKRDTKRAEDRAYCLFGIFDVSLSTRYGEGGDKAFSRLLAKISKLQNPASSLSANANEMNSTATTEQACREGMIASLAFAQIDARHSNIKDAQNTTCEWLLRHSSYIAWFNKDRHPGILWIAGKPGTGKSTLMKFVLAHARKNAIANEIILDFFFNARGDEPERTTLGMYRALLVQLLRQAPDLEPILDQVEGFSAHGSQIHLWTLSALERLLRAAIRALNSRKLKIFIDALDECNEEQVRDMIDFLEDLGENDLGDESRFSICLASRHYPAIEVRHSWRLILEDEVGHDEDLSKYIKRRLLTKGKSTDEIRSQVQEKANGVFMWVVLVVGVLNDEIRRGRLFAIKQRLQELPTGLSELFKDLLRRDDVNMDDLKLCLQWILFAKRPLSREEFYHAMESGLHAAPEEGETWRPSPWDPEKITVDIMDSLVLSSSKGLAEVTRSKKAPTVQFIHESVRDFLLKDNGLQDLYPELVGEVASHSHETLQRCCSDYLNADLSSHMDITRPLPTASRKEVKNLTYQICRQFPLLRYAHHGVFHHANETWSQACHTGVQDFNLQKWVTAQHLLESHEIRRYSSEVSLPYVLADNNFARLLTELPCQDLWLRLENERYQYPVLAAFASGHQETLSALLGDCSAAFVEKITKDPGFGKPSRCSSCQDPLIWAALGGNWAFVECLLVACSDKNIFSVSANRHNGWNAFSLAARDGSIDVIRLLVDNVSLPYHVDAGHSAIGQACLAGHEAIVGVILEAAAELTPKPPSFHLAMCAAAARGQASVVRMMIEAGMESDGYDHFRGRALFEACRAGQEVVVPMLIEAEAIFHASAQHPKRSSAMVYGDALNAAATGGFVNLVRMLLEARACIDAQNDHFLNDSLKEASRGGHERVVRMLLDAGADVNAR